MHLVVDNDRVDANQPREDLVPGRCLWTKDGRKIGNAVLIGVETDPVFGTVYKYQTDFGNIGRFRSSEIEEFFHIGDMCDLTERKTAQQKKLLGNQ